VFVREDREPTKGVSTENRPERYGKGKGFYFPRFECSFRIGKGRSWYGSDDGYGSGKGRGRG
jgi:hypothetical protein